ncbi:MAG: HAMP domain-containing histidine kinase [Xanthobacteraceae bacterium]|nr:HAMP domain-containing histidine kinase [Xanthobacteraceae bacterium]
MSPTFLKSLRARLAIGAAIWIAIGVTAAGIFITALFRQFANELMQDELRKHLDELVMLIDVDDEGFPHLYRPLSDPRFTEFGSGFAWQVTRSGKVLIKSISASTENIPVPDDPLPINDVREVALPGPHGAIVTYERLLMPEGSTQPPLRIQVGAESSVVDRMLPTFTVPLTVSLVLLAILLIAAAILQVQFGLQPMTRLRRALGAIGTGEAAKLPGGFPSEVQPLVDDLNNLLELNAQMVLRARTQAGNLAHALKTPLAVLTDEASRLADRGQADSADVILAQSQRMQRQIDYQIARARAAASRSVPGIVAPVAPAVANIVTAMQRLHAAKSLAIEEHVAEACVALCEPMDLNEILANVIDNACKWATERVTIRGALAEAGDRIVVTVDDDGPGLPAESLDIVFKVGKRLDEQVPGSGLGLPIVRDLLELYGGQIRLENRAGGGLRASLFLPRPVRS